MKRFIKLFFISLIFMVIHYIPSFALEATDYAEAYNPNAPVLLSGMTPVKWEGEYETKTSIYDLDWYDYHNKKWANVIDGSENYWVWIPRFVYKIEGNKVLLKWSSGINDDKDAIADGYMVHPAFVLESYIGGEPGEASSYDNRSQVNQLTGFWVAKYLASENNGDVLIRPNKYPDDTKSIGEAFDACLSIRNEQSASSHLIKASEWGAVAYLTNAYGDVPDVNSNELTGNEIYYSTTDNKFGVFDMNGPCGEYLSAFVVNGTIDSNSISYAGKLIEDEYDRFVDVVSLNGEDNASANDDRLNDFYGFAMSETKSFSSSDEEVAPVGAEPFFSKGGLGVGLYGYTKSDGTGLGYRPTISVYTSHLADELTFFDTEASIVSGDHLVLSVNFSVDQDWKFDLEPGEVIIENGKVVSGKEKRIFDFIDLRYVQNNETLTFTNANLNEHLIGIIEGDSTIEELTGETVFSANTEYTVRVRVGGYKDLEETKPVFLPIPGMTSKIVVESIDVKSAGSGSDLKVVSLANNKVRLSIYDFQGRTPMLTEVKLETCPDTVDYGYGDDLVLDGGKLRIFYGDNEAVVDLTKDNIHPDYRNITQNAPGRYKVELVYGDREVTQEEPIEFWINIIGGKKYSVSVESEPVGSASIVSGPGRYEEGKIVRLKAIVNPGYKFLSWSSSDDVSITNQNSIEASFEMPAKDVEVIVNTIGVMDLEVVGAKTEFEKDDPFGLGDGKIIASYPGGTSEVLTLDSPDVLSDPGNHEILNELGTKEVTIKYGDQEVSYEIEVVKKKYDMTVSIESAEYGSVKMDGEDIVPINDVISTTVRIPYDDTVSLEVVPNEGYLFDGWYVSESGVISEDVENNESISFIMPQKSFIIRANFTPSHIVKYLVDDDNCGYISGSTEQIVKHGGSATEVEAIANDGYKFKKWSDDRVSADRFDQDIIEDATYTATFVKIWTVTFMSEGSILETLTVEHGASANIPYVPQAKDSFYIFDKWNEEEQLKCVTRDIVANAVFVPRITIDPDGSDVASDYVEAHISAPVKGIKQGTLEYIISESNTDTGENISDYISNETFNFEGSWEIDSENPELYRSYVQLANKEDSSTTITICSDNDKELVKFDYKLYVTSGQMLGITVNGERITEYDVELDVWHGFNSEVNTIDGKIVVGISYSQDEEYSESDYAAIRNLKIGRQWIPISNEYDLKDSAIWTNNYVHIRGVGPDDGETYQIVSNAFIGNSENDGDLYSISYELNGGTVEGTNPTGYTKDSETITLINPTKIGATFVGWTGSCGTEPVTTVVIESGSTGNKSYTANWMSDGYLIAVTQSPNGTITPDSVSVTGGNMTFTMSPDLGYKVSDVVVDKESQGARNSYTFISVAEEHTITATFTPVYYSVSYDLDGGIDPGNATSYTILSEDITLLEPTKTGYVFDGWTGSNGDVPELDVTIPKGSTGDLSYDANWRDGTFTITVNQGENGTISPSSAIVEYGGSTTFDIIPDSGYIVSDVVVNGSSVGAVTSYTFSNVTKNQEISATFEVIPLPTPTVSLYTRTTSSFKVKAVSTSASGKSLVYELFVNGQSVATSSSTASGTEVTLTASGLKEYTTYSYYVVVTDGSLTAQSSTGSVRTYCSGTTCTSLLCEDYSVVYNCATNCEECGHAKHYANSCSEEVIIGSTECTWCNGTGKVSCTECGGTGSWNYTKCNSCGVRILNWFDYCKHCKSTNVTNGTVDDCDLTEDCDQCSGGYIYEYGECDCSHNSKNCTANTKTACSKHNLKKSHYYCNVHNLMDIGAEKHCEHGYTGLH